MEQSDKKMHIINVAELLFASNGFDGTSVRDIAREADVNVAMISYYFGSKEKLLEALFELRTTDTRLKLETLLADTKLSHMEKVFKLVDAYIVKFMEQQPFHKIMVREQVGSKDSPIAKLIKETKLRNQLLIRSLIQDGQKKGVFRKNVDIPLTMTTMVGTVNQLITAQHFYREINNLENMPEAEFQQLLRKKLSAHLKLLFKALLSNEA